MFAYEIFFSGAHTCNAHVVAMEGVRQAVSHHGVLQGGIAHLDTCSHVQGVRSLLVEPGNKHFLSRIINLHLL